MSVEHQARYKMFSPPIYWEVLFAVERVADNRMADTVKMHAELMTPASDRMRQHQRATGESLGNLKLGDGGLSVADIHGHSA